MTAPTELVITLPLPPNLANGRMHWRVKDKARKAYLAHCDLIGVGANMDAMITAPATRPATLAFTLYCANPHDDDNALSRCKFAADWLVKRKFLVDDSRKWCRFSIPSQVITRDKSKQRLEITIKYEDANGQVP